MLNINKCVSCCSVNVQKQAFLGVLQKGCSAKTQQIYWRSPIQKCHFNKVAWQKLLHKSGFSGM